MEYEIKALTVAEMQELIDDGTFTSCFTSSYGQLIHATKPTYNWTHLEDYLQIQSQHFDEIKFPFLNLTNWSTTRIQKIVEKPSGGLERIIGLRVGYYGPSQSWIAADVDQSTFYWAHIELTRNNTAGSKSWYYDPDYLKLEAPFYKAMGVTKWHSLMMPNTDYTDAVTAQAGIREDADGFKTPTWSDHDITYNHHDDAVAHNAAADADQQVDLNLYANGDVTTSWKKLEFNI